MLALRERFEHMGLVSGYDALYAHLPLEFSVDSIFCNFKKRYPRGIGRFWQFLAKFAHGSSFYNAQSAQAELKMFIRLLLKSYDIVHYAYAEPYLGFGTKLINRLIVVTNHQPVSWWQQNVVFLKKYERVSKVICLSDYDKEYFNARLPGMAVCIPHGVDTVFYCPNPGNKVRDLFTVIFSGRYLRDTSTLAKVVTSLSVSCLNIRFDIVYSEKATLQDPVMKAITGLPNVTWHTDVPQEKLRQLYQNADCCLIPLLDCTANNAILEAMACGVPVITTDLPAVKTYLDTRCAIFGRPHNPGDLEEAIKDLYRDRDRGIRMGVAAREKATMMFDWKIIAAKTAKLFSEIYESA